MRKYLVFLIIPFLMLSLASCSDSKNDEDVVEPEVQLPGFDVTALYVTKMRPNTFVPDGGSKFYIYYGVDNGDFASVEYLGNGMFKKKRTGEVIEPEESYVLDVYGKLDVTIKGAEEEVITILESNFNGFLSLTNYPPIALRKGKQIITYKNSIDLFPVD